MWLIIHSGQVNKAYYTWRPGELGLLYMAAGKRRLIIHGGWNIRLIIHGGRLNKLIIHGG